jgi:hypothetical protein
MAFVELSRPDLHEKQPSPGNTFFKSENLMGAENEKVVVEREVDVDADDERVSFKWDC